MSFSFNEPFGKNINDLYNNFLITLQKMTEEIDSFIENADINIENNDNKKLREDIQRINIHKKFINEECGDFFLKNKEYLSYSVVGKTFTAYLNEIRRLIIEKDIPITAEDISEVSTCIQNLIQAYFTIANIANNEKKTNKLISELEDQVDNAKKNVIGVISAREALESKSTEEIYSNAAKKYINTARCYDVLLLGTLGIFYYITSNFFENFQMISIFQAIKKSSSEAQTLAVFFFITKLTIVSIVITLATIFIRRSSHFRKLHDQANQTSLELNALPNYLRQVDSEHHSEIYKEMIPKFFGKELDQSQNDKVGDLVKDQLAAGTELIKASAEMVKNAKSLSGSADKTKNGKPNETSTKDKAKPESEA